MNVASTQKTIHQRTLQGTVVSDAMNKTRVVAITRLKKHSRYQKFFKVTTRYKAHDEENRYHVGDIVEIMQSRPLSRDKRWIITSLVGKAPVTQTDQVDTTSENDTEN